MWRSCLYSDVRIALTGNFSMSNSNAIFSSHQFILFSRSPCFLTNSLHGTDRPGGTSPALSIYPPCHSRLPLCISCSVSSTLAPSFLPTEHLTSISHFTSCALCRTLLSILFTMKYKPVSCKKCCMACFHPFLEFSENERITGGKWGTGGCQCPQCTRRAPRVLEFTMSDDVKNPVLDQGTRHALVGLFGEGRWMAKFSSLPQQIKDTLLKCLCK